MEKPPPKKKDKDIEISASPGQESEEDKVKRQLKTMDEAWEKATKGFDIKSKGKIKALQARLIALNDLTSIINGRCGGLLSGADDFKKYMNAAKIVDDMLTPANMKKWEADPEYKKGSGVAGYLKLDADFANAIKIVDRMQPTLVQLCKKQVTDYEFCQTHSVRAYQACLLLEQAIDQVKLHFEKDKVITKTASLIGSALNKIMSKKDEGESKEKQKEKKDGIKAFMGEKVDEKNNIKAKIDKKSGQLSEIAVSLKNVQNGLDMQRSQLEKMADVMKEILKTLEILKP